MITVSGWNVSLQPVSTVRSLSWWKGTIRSWGGWEEAVCRPTLRGCLLSAAFPSLPMRSTQTRVRQLRSSSFHLLALWPWSRSLISLWLHFLTWRVELIVLLTLLLSVPSETVYVRQLTWCQTQKWSAWTWFLPSPALGSYSFREGEVGSLPWQS